MNLRAFSDDELHQSNQKTAEEDRQVTLKLLKHLAETERRHLFSKFECDSLFAYCVKYLKMSDPDAGRRIASARLLNEFPVIEEKVATGAMSLTSVCQAGTFFKKEAQAGNRFEQSEKLELINQLDDLSTRKVDRVLMAHSANPSVHIKEVVKQKTEALTEIKVIADVEMMNDLDRLKEIFSHAMPGATFSAIIKRISKEAVEKHDPDLKAKRAIERAAKAQACVDPTPLNEIKPADEPSDQRIATTAPELKISDYIPSAVRHFVWMRDQGRCTFVDAKTGECCESKRQVEFDHIIAFATGGKSVPENLRLRCRAHNIRHSIETFGFSKANEWRQRSVSFVKTLQLAYG